LDEKYFKQKCREIRNTHFVVNNFFPLKAWPFLYTAEEYGTARPEADGNTTWRMRFACWVTKPADTHS
jgi:hypothetical protein